MFSRFIIVVFLLLPIQGHAFFLMLECSFEGFGTLQYGEIEKEGRVEPALKIQLPQDQQPLLYDFWASAHGWVVFVKDAKSLQDPNIEVDPVYHMIDISNWRDDQPFSAIYRQVQNGDFLLEKQISCNPS